MRPARVQTAARRVPAPYRVAAALALGLGVDVVVDPAHTHVPLCPLRAMTGLWCPLCGGLRAADALVHLDVTAALRDNALLVVAVPCALVFWLDWTVCTRAGRPGRSVPRSIVVATVVLAAVFTVARNLPGVGILRGG